MTRPNNILEMKIFFFQVSHDFDIYKLNKVYKHTVAKCVGYEFC